MDKVDLSRLPDGELSITGILNWVYAIMGLLFAVIGLFIVVFAAVITNFVAGAASGQ